MGFAFPQGGHLILDAHLELLTGRAVRTDVARAASLGLYRQALAIDPDYAQAQAELGFSNYHLWMSGHDRREETWATARAAGERALALDPANGTAHNLLAFINMGEGAFEAAEALWLEGLAIDPGHGAVHLVYSIFLLCTGRIEEARAHLFRARDLDPKDPKVHSALGIFYLIEGNYPAAIEEFEQLPAGQDSPLLLSYSQHLAGNDARAADVALDPLPAEPEAALRSVFEQGGYTGIVRAGVEFQILESGKRCTSAPVSAALQFAVIGEAERMFQCLDEVETATNRDHLSVWFFLAFPDFRPYRDDPRFIATMNRLVPEL